MNEFLNPKSMVTPGAVGAMVMLITNSLCSQFPDIAAPRWTAIILSFLFATFVLSNKEITLRAKAVFWIINSLIIFSVSVGTNNIGIQAANSSDTLAQIEPTALLRIGISDASAQDSPDITHDSSESASADTQDSELLEELAEKEQEIQNLASEIKKLKEEQAAKTEENTPTGIQEPHEHRFFKKW